jgi:heme/copper-type cytochrome/quinol oxidase subunit 1
MRCVELHGRRFVTARIAHVTGAVLWWVFVVARLMAEMNSAAWNSGLPRRYADYDESIFGVGLGHKDFGWTAYEPLTDHPPSSLNDGFFIVNVIASVAVAALAITAIAAIVEAISVARWPAGIATILTPITGATIILSALHYGTGFGGGLKLSLLVVFALVLLGVAIREMWSRVWAPRPTRAE